MNLTGYRHNKEREERETMKIITRKSYIFRTTDTRLQQFNDKRVLVINKLSEEEAEELNMYNVCLNGVACFTVYEDELHEV
ncbi:hypothetical protein JEFDOCMN_00004 [Enterococcus phage vB_OCPT_CCS1]|uniref:Uncharacterized protein n=3 Tax=Schiekvirus TaxID=2732968 RepID=A0A9E7J2X4_9CAUD|nr:hypothetical protein JEFDOCMN_00004 [Enterococcus phage vB_OCPT_CCS1]